VEQLRAGVVVRDQLFESEHQGSYIATSTDLSQRFEIGFNTGLWQAVSRKDPDLLVGGGNGIFLYGTEFFIKLLTGAYTCELDLNVFIGS